MESNLRPDGANMEPKRHPKINVFFDGFSDASGNIGGTATVAASVTLSPADPPGRRHIIKEYCIKTSKDSIAYKI